MAFGKENGDGAIRDLVLCVAVEARRSTSPHEDRAVQADHDNRIVGRVCNRRDDSRRVRVLRAHAVKEASVV